MGRDFRNSGAVGEPRGKRQSNNRAGGGPNQRHGKGDRRPKAAPEKSLVGISKEGFAELAATIKSLDTTTISAVDLTVSDEVAKKRAERFGGCVVNEAVGAVVDSAVLSAREARFGGANAADEVGVENTEAVAARIAARAARFGPATTAASPTAASEGVDDEVLRRRLQRFGK